MDIDHSMYADDLKMSHNIDSDEDALKQQHYLDKVVRWGTLDQLKLNSSTTQCITISRRQSRHILLTRYFVDSIELSRVQVVKDLGLYLDRNIDFLRHCDRVKRFTKEFNDARVSKALYVSLVRSSLDYAAPV